MAERTAEGGVRLSLVLDKDGKPFVQQVDQAMAGATAAVQGGARKAGASFGEILGSGFILKAAAATVVLRRLTATAGDSSPEFRQLKKEASEAGKAIGTDLQYAIGSLLGPAKVFLDWIEQANSGVRLFLGGTVLASTALTPFKALLTSLGLSGGAATLVLLGLGAALGGLAGKAANEAKNTEVNFNKLVSNVLKEGEDIAKTSREKIAQELAEQQALLRDNQEQLKDFQANAAQAGDATGVGAARTGFTQTAIAQEREFRDAVAASEGQVATLTSQLAAYDEALGVFARSNVTLGDGDLGVGDFIQRQQLAIATGAATLTSARDAVRARREEVESELKILRNAVRLKDTSDAEVSAVFTRLAGGDATKAAELQAEAAGSLAGQKKYLAILDKESVSLLQAQLDLTDRIGEASAKVQSTELNRKVLQAQLVDALRGLGPVLEKQVLEEERRRLAIDEGGRAKTRILELDNQILGLSQQIAQVEARRAELAKQESDAKWREEVAQFQSAYLDNLNIEIALARLAAESDQTFRRQRIADLSQELGLRSLTVQALEDELAAINESAAIAPELAAQRRQQLTELIGLLGEERQALSGSSEELNILTDGFRRLSDQASLALVQTFTRGKAQVKDFADFALQTFEQMFAQLLSREVVLAFISLFTGGLFSGGARGVGSGIPLPYDFGGAGAARFRPGPLPALPNPNVAQAGSLGRLEAKLDAMASSIGSLKLQVAPLVLRGKDLHGAVQIVDATKPTLKSR